MNMPIDIFTSMTLPSAFTNYTDYTCIYTLSIYVSRHVGCHVLYCENVGIVLHNHCRDSLRAVPSVLLHHSTINTLTHLFSAGRIGRRTKDKVVGQLLKSLQYEIFSEPLHSRTNHTVGMI